MGLLNEFLGFNRGKIINSLTARTISVVLSVWKYVHADLTVIVKNKWYRYGTL